MLKNWDKENYRIYGVSLNGYDCDDITCDVLSNVRGRFFLTGCSQKDRLVKNGEIESVKYIYSLEKDRPLFWRVYKNSKLSETSHKNGDGSYYVETTNDKGTAERKIFFSSDHQWIRAEYYNSNGFNGGQILVSSGFKDGKRVFIKKSSSQPQPVTLYKCNYEDDPEILERAFMRNVSVDVSVFSSEGLEYYADAEGVKRFETIVEDIKKEIAEEKKEEFDVTARQVESGFNFKPEYFKNNSGKIDIRNARNYGEAPAFEQKNMEDMYEDGEEFNAPPKGFENIPMNGVAMETSRTVVSGNDFVFDNVESESENPDYSGEDVIDLSAPVKETKKKHKTKESLKAHRKEKQYGDMNESFNSKERMKDTMNNKMVYSEEADVPVESGCEDKNVTVNPWKDKCDMTLNLNNEIYRYYGETNSRNERNGYGRTEQPNGRTAYEGEYFKDHREGFGVHYYKDDGVYYAGTWKNNKREGMGVGFKPDDGSVLAGKWSDNKPQGVCVKFDKEGNVTYYGKYVDGKREGFSVVFREDGVLEVVKWKNDEKSPLVREIDLSELI